MIQKIYALLLCFLLTLSLAACKAASQDDTIVTTAPNNTPSTTTVPNTTPSTTTAPQSSILEDSDFQALTLVDNEDVCFRITAIENDAIWGYTLKVYIENKTDKELMFSVDDVSVNGFMCDPFWAETVSPGKKSNSTISWFESDFEENEISEVEEITFTLNVYDSNDYNADDILQQEFIITP